MAQSTSQIAVGGSGNVYLKTYDGTVPTDLTAPGTTYTDVGYTTEDGVTFTTSFETERLAAWQTMDPVRIIQTSRTFGVSFTLRQLTLDNLKFAFGGGTKAAGTPGTYTFAAATAGLGTVSCVVDAIDGSGTVRFIYPLMQVSGDIEMSIVRNNSINIPVSLTNLASSTQPTIISNVTGFTS